MDIVIQILTILLLGVTFVFAAIPLIVVSFIFWIMFVDIRDYKAPKKGRCE
jgi:hypothetical protein